MRVVKTFDLYKPYQYAEEGKEYDLEEGEDEEVIDYENNYYQTSFEEYWTTILDRYKIYLSIKGNNYMEEQQTTFERIKVTIQNRLNNPTLYWQNSSWDFDLSATDSTFIESKLKLIEGLTIEEYEDYCKLTADEINAINSYIDDVIKENKEYNDLINSTNSEFEAMGYPLLKESFKETIIEIAGESLYVSLDALSENSKCVECLYPVTEETRKFFPAAPYDNFIRFLLNPNYMIFTPETTESGSGGTSGLIVDNRLYIKESETLVNAFIQVTKSIYTESTSDRSIMFQDEEIEYLLNYVEYNKKLQKIKHRIESIYISAPIGTIFYINRVLNPICITQRANSNSYHGIYELNVDDLLRIKYITFPANAIPGSGEYLDPGNTTERSIQVSFSYDDEYDIELTNAEIEEDN